MTVTVTKTWLTPAGDSQAGTVRFRLVARLTDVTPGTDVATDTVTATLDDTGSISQTLYPGVYDVQELFGGYEHYRVPVTADGELPTPTDAQPDMPSGDAPLIDGGSL